MVNNLLRDLWSQISLPSLWNETCMLLTFLAFLGLIYQSSMCEYFKSNWETISCNYQKRLYIINPDDFTRGIIFPRKCVEYSWLIRFARRWVETEKKTPHHFSLAYLRLVNTRIYETELELMSKGLVGILNQIEKLENIDLDSTLLIEMLPKSCG